MRTNTCKKCGKKWQFEYDYQKRQFCSRSCKSSYENTNERHPGWKGGDITYNSLHRWVQRQLGKPKKCIDCGAKGKTSTAGKWTLWWSNKSGRYLRDLSDWEARCRKCHYKYDIGTEKQAKYTPKGMVLTR